MEEFFDNVDTLSVNGRALFDLSVNGGLVWTSDRFVHTVSENDTEQEFALSLFPDRTVAYCNGNTTLQPFVASAELSAASCLVSIRDGSYKISAVTALSSCKNLTSVTFPGVQFVQPLAFYNCTALSSVDLRNADCAGKNAFRNCKNLETLQLPNLSSSYRNPVVGCSNLQHVIVGNGILKSAGDGVGNDDKMVVTTDGKNLKFVVPTILSVLNSDLTSLGEESFGQTKIRHVDVPNVQIVGEAAFYYCYDLTSVRLSENVENLGEETFEQCSSLSSIDLPSCLLSAGYATFKNCSSLSSITFPDGFRSLASEYTLQKGYSQAFQGCSNLLSVYLPDSFTDDTLYYQMFSDCKKLKYVRIPPSVKTIGQNVFANTISLLSIDLNQTETFRAFDEQKAAMTFQGSNVKHIVANNLTSFGLSPFNTSYKLRRVDMSENDNFVNQSNLGTLNSTQLIRIYVKNEDMLGRYTEDTAWKTYTNDFTKNCKFVVRQEPDITFVTNAKDDIGNNISVKYEYEYLTSELSQYKMRYRKNAEPYSENQYLSVSSNLKGIVDDNGHFRTVGASGLSGANTLEFFSAAGVTLLQENAFRACYRLSTVILPNLETINTQAFYDIKNTSTSKSFLSVYCPKLQTINNYAFAYVNAPTVDISQISIPPNITTNAFSNMLKSGSKLPTFIIPNGMTQTFADDPSWGVKIAGNVLQTIELSDAY